MYDRYPINAGALPFDTVLPSNPDPGQVWITPNGLYFCCASGQWSLLQAASLANTLRSRTTLISPAALSASSFQGPPVVVVPGVAKSIVVAFYMIARIIGGTVPGNLLPDDSASGVYRYGMRNEWAQGIGQVGIDLTPVTFAGADANGTNPQLLTYPFGVGNSDWDPPPNTDPAYIGDDFCIWMPSDAGFSGGDYSIEMTTLYVLNKATA